MRGLARMVVASLGLAVSVTVASAASNTHLASANAAEKRVERQQDSATLPSLIDARLKEKGLKEAGWATEGLHHHGSNKLVAVVPYNTSHLQAKGFR